MADGAFSSMPAAGKGARGLWGLVLFVFALYAITLVNHGQYWDGWIVSQMIEAGDWESVRELYAQTGQPLAYWVFYALGHTGLDFILSYRVFIIACMVMLALSTLRIGERGLRLRRAEALFVAAFTVSWPFYQAFICEIFPYYVLTMSLFFAGWAMYFLAKERTWMLVLCFFAWSVCAYTINSLLFYYYGFVLVLFLQEYYDIKLLNCLRHLKIFISRHWGLLLFPPLLFIAKSLLSRPYGMYADYNALLIQTYPPGEALGLFLKYCLFSLASYRQIILGFGQAIEDLWPAVIVVLTLIFLRHPRLVRCCGMILLLPLPFTGEGRGEGPFAANALPSPRKSKVQAPKISYLSRTRERGRKAGMTIALGLIFILLAIIPYAAAGKFIYRDWGERHGMLLPFGMALVLVGLGRWKKLPSQWLAAIAIIILGIHTLTLVHRFILWQGRAGVEQALVERLRGIDAPKKGTVLIVDVPPAVQISQYRTYELAGLIHHAWPQQAWYPILKQAEDEQPERYLAFYQEDVKNEFQRNSQNLRNFTPNGCAVVLEFTLRQGLTLWDMALYYYRHGGRSDPTLIDVRLRIPDPQAYAACADL